MNSRYTVYNRVTGLHMENGCRAANGRTFVMTLPETAGPEDRRNAKVMHKDGTGGMVPLMGRVMGYGCPGLARAGPSEAFVTGHIRILSREDYNSPADL